MRKYFSDDYLWDHPIWHSLAIILGSYLVAILAVMLSGALGGWIR